MTSRKKKSFLEYWRSKEERRALLQRTNKLRLSPSQQSRLLCDSGVRAELQNARITSLLPPVGTEVFRRLTPASLGEIRRQREQQKTKNKEASVEDPLRPTSDLEAGKRLPFFYGKPPTELLNTPLEELDPFYQSQKTFIVLSKGNIIHRFNADPSCYQLSPFSLLRTIAIKILTQCLFIMVTILTNCAFLTLSYPPGWSEIAEYVFIAIYTFEAIIKIAARGFCVGRFTYLRDPWNGLDVVIIIMAYLSEFVDLGNTSAIRILKFIAVIPGLRTTFGTLVQSAKRQLSVLAMTAFFLVFFAAIGLQSFMGDLRQKCVKNLYHVYNNSIPSNISIDDPGNHYFKPRHFDAVVCRNRSDYRYCPEGFTCMKAGSNPNYGFTNYDSFGWALLSTFRLMTQDYWEDLAQKTLAVSGKIFMVYFVVVLFVGSFYLLSLFVATIAMATAEHNEACVAEAKRREEEHAEILQALKKSEEDETEVSDKKDSPPQRKNSAAEIKNHKQEHAAIEGFKEERRSCPPCCVSFADHFLKWNCCGCWRWLKQRLHAFVTHPYFDIGIIVCLIINAAVSAIDHYPMTIYFYAMKEYTFLVLVVIFVLEIILKVIALDPYGYFQVGWNVFDSIVALTTLLELLMYDIAGLRMLGLFQLLRLIRLARYWPSFNLLLRIMRSSMGALRNLTLVLVLMVFFFTVTGVQLFGKGYNDCVCRISVDCELPRWHMADLFHAFLIIFRILCGQWIETLWDCMEVSGQTTCLIFFITVLVVGKLLVLSLFVALLLANAAAPDEERGENKQQIIINHIKKAVDCGHGTEVKNEEDDKKEYLALNLVSSYEPAERDDAQKVQENKDDKDHDGNTPENCCWDKCYQHCSFLDIDTSRGIWRVWTNFRRCCLSIVEHRGFEIFINFVILLSCAALVFYDIHLENRKVLKVVLDYAEPVFACVFVVEMILKIVAFGFKRYFTDKWCWVDFIVVIVSLTSVTSSALGNAGLTSIKCLRALRTVSRFQGTRVVVDVLCSFIPSLVDMLLVCLFTWLIFSIAGVYMFAGKFYYCYNKTSDEWFLHDEIANLTECFYLREENYTEVWWKNQVFNYDNVVAGYVSLLQVLFKGGMDIIYAAVDTRMVESQPGYENSLFAYWYFISFIVTSFFVLNFFIRGFINKLNQLRHKFGGKHIFLTAEQKKLYRIMKTQLSNNKRQTPAPRPQNKFRAFIFDLATSHWFDVFMFVMICFNMAAVMTDSDDPDQMKDKILYWIFLVFVVIFLIESVLKLIGLGWRYFRDAWNVLDFVLVIGSIIGLFIADFLEYHFMSVMVFPVIRSLRVFRILPLSPGMAALGMALPALFNIGLLLFFVMFTFSAFGMSTFAYVKKDAMMDDLINFETFSGSMTSMFIVATGTGLDGLLYPIMVKPPDCDPDIDHPGFSARGDCGFPKLGVVFFASFIAVSSLLVVCMFVAIVLEIFDMDADDSGETLSDDDLQMFYNTWKMFDPDESQCIQYSKLSDFCDTLKDPLRIPKPNTMKLIHMDLPLLPGDKIYYLDILLALRAQVFGDSGQVDALKANMEEKFKAKNSSKMSYEPISSTLRRKQEEMAVAVIQRAYRKWRMASKDGTEAQINQLNGDAKEMEMEPAR